MDSIPKYITRELQKHFSSKRVSEATSRAKKEALMLEELEIENERLRDDLNKERSKSLEWKVKYGKLKIKFWIALWVAIGFVSFQAGRLISSLLLS
jgi:hypothetical protein